MNNSISYLRQGSFQTSLVTPEEVKEKYQAVKLHFSSKNYDYFKYQGKVKKNNFADIIPYTIISKGKYKTDFPDFFIPGLFQNPKVNIEYFMNEDYLKIWKYWKSYQTSPIYFFKEELIEVESYLNNKQIDYNSLFKISENELPLLYKFLIKSQISPQTVIYLDQVLNFRKTFSRKVTENIMFPKLDKRIQKISSFIRNQDSDKLKKVVKEIFCA